MPKAKPGERTNTMEICSSCGAQMEMSAPGALVRDCGSCGARLAGATPPVESIANLCRECRHPLDPEHDALGCNVPDCPCAFTGSAIEFPSDALPNAGADAYGKALDKLGKLSVCAACREPITGTPKVVDGKDYHSQGSCAPLEKKNVNPPSPRDDKGWNEKPSTFVFRDANGEDISVTAASLSDAWAKLQEETSTAISALQAAGVKLAREVKNSAAAERWNSAPADRGAWLGRAGLPEIGPDGDRAAMAWDALPLHARVSLENAGEAASAGDEEKWKDKSDYAPDGGCKKCKWGAPGTGHSSGYHKADCAVLKKERDAYTHFQGAERRNAGPGGFDYKRVDTSTVKGIEEAEALQAKGWKIIQSGMFSVLMESPKGAERGNASDHAPTGKRDGGFELVTCPKDGLEHRKVLGADGKERCGACDAELTNASYPARDAYSAHQDMCPTCMGASSAGEHCAAGGKLFEAVRSEMRREDVATMRRKDAAARQNAGYENDSVMQGLKAEMDRRVAADPSDSFASNWLKNYAQGLKAQAEQRNDLVPDGDAQMDAFEGHVENCASCSAEYSNAAPDPAKLCEEGRRLLAAPAPAAENAGAEKEWWCLTCGKAVSAKDREPGGEHEKHDVQLAEKTNAGDAWLQKVAKASGVPYSEVQKKWAEHVRTVSNENPATFQAEFLDWYGLKENGGGAPAEKKNATVNAWHKEYQEHAKTCADCQGAGLFKDHCAKGQELLREAKKHPATEKTNGRACATCGQRAENWCGTCEQPVCDACAEKAGSFKGAQAYCPKCGNPEKRNAGPGSKTRDGKTIDDVAREMTGKAYRALPDDGPEQEAVMGLFEQEGGVAQQAFTNAHPLDDRAKEDAGAMWDQASDSEKRKIVAEVGLGIGIIQFRWVQMPDSAKQKLLTEFFGLENAEKIAKGGDEAGKPGGTVTVINAGESEGDIAVKMSQVRARMEEAQKSNPNLAAELKKELAELEKKLYAARDSDENENADDNAHIEAARALITGGAAGPRAARAAFKQAHPDQADDRIAHFVSSAYRRLGQDPAAMENAEADNAGDPHAELAAAARKLKATGMKRDDARMELQTRFAGKVTPGDVQAAMAEAWPESDAGLGRENGGAGYSTAAGREAAGAAAYGSGR